MHWKLIQKEQLKTTTTTTTATTTTTKPVVTDNLIGNKISD